MWTLMLYVMADNSFPFAPTCTVPVSLPGEGPERFKWPLPVTDIKAACCVIGLRTAPGITVIVRSSRKCRDNIERAVMFADPDTWRLNEALQLNIWVNEFSLDLPCIMYQLMLAEGREDCVPCDAVENSGMNNEYRTFIKNIFKEISQSLVISNLLHLMIAVIDIVVVFWDAKSIVSGDKSN